MEEDSLSASAIIDNLDTHFVGQRVIYYPRLTSTMEAAKREAQQGAAEGTVIVAGEQTAGKGRLKRIWLSPRGNIALSVILHPDVTYLPFLIMVASLAVVHCVEAVTGLKARIKWPNDVLINNKKAGGILIEGDVKGNTVDYAIIGIGVNVNLRLSDFPEIQSIATSLSDELGKEVSQLEVIRQLLVEVERLYVILQTGGSLFEEWRDRLVTLGRKVEVEWGKNTCEGVAESVTTDGSLLLRRSDGSLTKITGGDVNLRD